MSRTGSMDFKLNVDGTKCLAMAVLKSGVKEEDFYFFESGAYLFYEDLADVKHEKEFYINLIKLRKER